MPKQRQTAVVIPVPDAEPLLTAVTRHYPEAVRGGVPAHVSLLYPFVPADQLDTQVIARLSGLFDAQPVISTTFRTIGRHDGFVCLRPDPPTMLDGVTTTIRQTWPSLTPYNGRYGDVAAHLTVAIHTSSARAAEIERTLLPTYLPVEAELREAWLVVFDQRWSLRKRFEFGAGSPDSA